jgi:hypothetical protein
MRASFVSELVRSPAPGRFAACVRPDKVALSHRLFTAALRYHRDGMVADVPSAS